MTHPTTTRAVEHSTPTESVVAAVADATGSDPLDLPPLADTLDPDALDSLFGDRYGGTARLGGTVRFTFAGCDVVVESAADRVVVTPHVDAPATAEAALSQ